jgi:hypothetical protein
MVSAVAVLAIKVAARADKSRARFMQELQRRGETPLGVIIITAP